MWKCLWLPLKNELAHSHQDCMQHRISKEREAVSWTIEQKLTWPKKNTTPEFDSDFPEPAIDWIEILACKPFYKRCSLVLSLGHTCDQFWHLTVNFPKSPHMAWIWDNSVEESLLLVWMLGSLLVGGAWWCQSVKARNHFWRLTSHCISCSRKSQIWKFWQISSETSFTLRHCCSTAALSLGQQPVSLWQLHRVQLFSLKITSFQPQNVFTVSRRQLKWIKCEVKSAPRPI